MILENWRGDSVYLGGVKSAQLVSGLIFISALVILYQRSGRNWQEDIITFRSDCLSFLRKAEYKGEKVKNRPIKKIKRGVKVGRDAR